ncbi:MAG: hypothetical protein Q7T33_16035 [Dehalococcoidia bacterium]|nr:hypothetical protein [Dehalococcoidia bacterium]
MSVRKRPNVRGEGRVRRDAGRRSRWAVTLLRAVAFLTALVVAGLLLGNGSSSGEPPRSRTAAIIDQLSLTVPNPDFRKSATETMEKAGYAVDYYSGEEVTVDFYRDLPLRRYDLLVMRVHAGLIRDRGSLALTPENGIGLFTNEPYDPAKYPQEQAQTELNIASYGDDSPRYFGITRGFVESSMRGRFNRTRVILMGCDGLATTRTAQAFLDRGASAFVSWSDTVTASHTDAATQRLLERLLHDGLSAADAVSATAAEVGPDPQTGAELRILTSGG